MSIKKLLILSAAGLAAVSSAAALAGGPDQMEPHSLFAPAVYMDVHGGYAFSNVSRLVGGTTGGIWFDQESLSNNQNGGAIGGVDLGLQVFKNIAVEVGGFYLPQVTGTANESTNARVPSCTVPFADTSKCQQAKQWNWMAYAAGRFNVHMPYVEGLDMFAKVGAGWRAMSNQKFSVAGKAGMHSFWTVIYGAGFDYDILQTGFRVGAQWMHIPSHLSGQETAVSNNSNNSQLATRQPAADLVTGSLGYRFDF